MAGDISSRGAHQAMAEEMPAEPAGGTSWGTTPRPLPPSRSARSPRRSPA